MYKLVERQGMIKLNEHVSITGEKILETPYGKTPQEIASGRQSAPIPWASLPSLVVEVAVLIRR